MYIPVELIINIISTTLTWFFISIGVLTFVFPIKLSLHKPHGIVFGIGVTTSLTESELDMDFIFFQVYLIFFSMGIFINLGQKTKEE